ncbi:MAG TPA: hypothetical protein VGO52_06695 [Hyphomonadaceae bacterium]|jgi:hypothetical protein|nr:hypothetical protein [Hyphomonadaceae bacterium]
MALEDDPDYQASRAVPSNHSNRAYVSIHGGQVRLAFGEAPEVTDETKYYSAVLMSKTDARELATLILQLIRQTDPPSPPNAFNSYLAGGPPQNGLTSGIGGGPPRVRRP